MSVDKQSKTTDASIASATISTSSPAAASADFDPSFCTKAMLRNLRFGALATIDQEGAPFSSLVNVATSIDGTPIILISRLALHTRNILGDSRVSLLLSEPVGTSQQNDPSAQPRVSISADAAITSDPDDRRRFLARHPGAAIYADFSDFAFYRLIPKHYHLVAGFGRIHGLTPAQVLSDPAAASDLAKIEEEAIAHLNKEHQDTLTLYATELAGGGSGKWLATGIDPEGIDLCCSNAITRIWFDKTLQNASQLRPALKALADKARAARQSVKQRASNAS